MRVLRIGKISSVNYPAGTARVTYEDRESATTNELPFLAWTYWMPKVGERVLVGHLSDGASAIIIGPVWFEGHRPVDSGEDLYRQELDHTPGTAYVKYHDNDRTVTTHAGVIAFESDGGNTTIADILRRIERLESFHA